LEGGNLREIESLNQRGGRTLTVVDLIADDTLTTDMVALLLAMMTVDTSVITAARASGTGKSTLLANLLALLPPGERIISTSSPEVINTGMHNREPGCYLAHEIGPGRWYGYIWGEHVRDYFALAEQGHRLATCLHADTLEELIGLLSVPPLDLSAQAIRAVDMLCFMRARRGPVEMHRYVSAIYLLHNGEYRLAYSWEADSDQFLNHGAGQLLPEAARRALPSAQQLIERIVDEDIRDLAQMRQRVVDWYDD
jgi:energy-coupling factor transporter ATP-binding protein EcfA2